MSKSGELDRTFRAGVGKGLERASKVVMADAHDAFDKGADSIAVMLRNTAEKIRRQEVTPEDKP